MTSSSCDSPSEAVLPSVSGDPSDFLPAGTLIQAGGLSLRVVSTMGVGAFAAVFKVVENDTKTEYALKVSLKAPHSIERLTYEAKVFEYLKKAFPLLSSNRSLAYQSHFVFNSRLCILMDLLGPSLYAIAMKRKFIGLPLRIIQKILNDILLTLVELHSKNIAHCDIKPENILSVTADDKEMDTIIARGDQCFKLIDFGICSHLGGIPQFYVQSIFYRSPEVILKIPFTTKIDIWSLGCVAFEMMVGVPLFQAESVFELLVLMQEHIGSFDKPFISKSPCASQFFLSNGELKSLERLASENSITYHPMQSAFIYKGLREIVMNYSPGPAENEYLKEKKGIFVDLLSKMLKLNPDERLTAAEALRHPFFSTVF